jgi:hypothetical protein
MQDAAGDWHDWFTLTRTAAKRLGDVHESSLVAALHNVTGAKFRSAVTVLSAMRAGYVPSKSASKAVGPARQGTLRRPRKTTEPAAATAA